MSRIAWAVFALLLIGLGVGLFAALRPVDDRILVRQALDRAIEAGKNGEPGGVLDLLSQDLQVNGATMGFDPRLVSDFVRQNRPIVEVAEAEPQFIGQEARIVSPVTIEMPVVGRQTLPGVTLIFQKESEPLYGIFPGHKWRLTEVRSPEGLVDSFTR
jgi:hypothetical protein